MLRQGGGYMTRALWCFGLLLMVFSAHATPKDRLVLMPLHATEVDRALIASMEASLVEGLKEQYTVFAGEQVQKKVKEVFEKESKAAKKECDETRCIQDIAIAFQAELIAVVDVAKRSGGYFLTLNIRNITNDEAVASRSRTCKNCDEFQMVDAIRELTRSDVGTASPSTAPRAGGGFSLGELDRQAQAEEGEKKKWANYRAEMKNAYAQVQAYEQRDIAAKLKTQAWERFLEAYAQDDPYSGEDEVMRGQAQVRIAVLSRRTGLTFRDKLKDGSDGPPMVVIPGGSVLMGSPEGEEGREKDEGPQHRVDINAFALGQTELTRGEFRAFADATHYKTDSEKDAGGEIGCRTYSDHDFKSDWRAGRSWRDLGYDGFQQDDRHPVVCVSLNDAQAYTEWLSKQTGKKYRLPTEAEWEYAARAGTRMSRYWGDNAYDACGYANVADQTKSPAGFGFSTTHNCNDGYFYAAPVGRYKLNDFGLYDMLGNVWEWTCSDYTERGYDGHETRCGEDGRRSARGGSWSDKPAWVRFANRTWIDSASRYDFVGFRLAQDL